MLECIQHASKVHVKLKSFHHMKFSTKQTLEKKQAFEGLLGYDIFRDFQVIPNPIELY